MLIRYTTISTIIILFSTIQLFGNEFRILKGKLIGNEGEVFIGAKIEEYKNGLNYVLSDINGEFEIVIPNKSSVIIRVTFGCSSFHDVLYEVKAEHNYAIVELFTKQAEKNTKRIKRKFKNKIEKNYFFIRFDEGLKTKSLAIRDQISKFGLLFQDWNHLKIIAYQETGERANEFLDVAEKELFKISARLRVDRATQISKDENPNKRIVKVIFINKANSDDNLK